MATIRKRGKSYQIDYYDPGGKRVRKTFDKKKDAEAELGKRVSLMAENRYLDVKKDYKTTFKELLDRYEENHKHQVSFRRWKKYCIKNFKEYFGEKTLLSNIRYVVLETYRNALRKKLTHNGTVRTDAAVNREMSCLRHILSKGVEWEMMEQNPFEQGKSLLFKENNKRLRYLTEEEIERLLSRCEGHLWEVVVCALNTGMRRGEILSLKWSQIRNGFIYLEQTKTNEPRQIPVNETLAQLFKEMRKELQLTSQHVFRYRTKKQGRGKKHLKAVSIADRGPLRQIKRSFKSALKKAGITDFRFHDLRHTFASHMLMNGASLKDVQKILGHKTMSMTLRYAHLSQEHKKKAVNLLNGLTASKNPSQNFCHKNVTFGHKSKNPTDSVLVTPCNC